LYLRSDAGGNPRLALLAPTGALGEAVSIDAATKVGFNFIDPPAQISVQPLLPGRVGALVRGAASQTANLQEWQSSAGTILGRVAADGSAFFASQNMSVSNGGVLRAVQSATINDFTSMREENSGGLLRLTKQTAAAANPASGQAKIYLRDGTNAGTLKLVVRAGAAGAETTILDNIPQ
jgi:hypothetical protein